MRQTSFADMYCSLARTMEVVGDWWSPLILRDLYLGFRRFDDLAEDLGISRNLLTARLKALVENGIVDRSPYQDRPVRYEYTLTEAGRDLVPTLLALTAWGDRWVAPQEGPPIRVRHTTCGQVAPPTVCCSACGEPLTADDVEMIPGPGGRAAPGTMAVGRFLKA
ncbi:winged helix-turn-helix transcriptional regulator [Nonomuraea sp. NPDC050556]|uniref:winged helix-turn-helix transcriptional regulator n=1 Tax=Nonomuraea sp. NPDC050556 TaxID=3364369 RepID=UPI0037A4606A